MYGPDLVKLSSHSYSSWFHENSFVRICRCLYVQFKNCAEHDGSFVFKKRIALFTRIPWNIICQIHSMIFKGLSPLLMDSQWGIHCVPFIHFILIFWEMNLNRKLYVDGDLLTVCFHMFSVRSCSFTDFIPWIYINSSIICLSIGWISRGHNKHWVLYHQVLWWLYSSHPWRQNSVLWNMWSCCVFIEIIKEYVI